MEVELWLTDREGERIAPLRDANFEFCEWVLNDVGTANISSNPLSPNIDRIEGLNTEVQIWIDGVLRWWGPVWGLTGGPDKINTNLESVESYFKKQFIDRTSLTYTSIDQFQIAANLITYAQSESVELYRDRNIGFASFSPSGVDRSRNYKLDDHALIWDLLREFDSRNLKNGFDWEIDISGGGGARFWTPFYPKKGSNKLDHAILWDRNGSQRNVTSFAWTEDFGNIGTKTIVTGGSVTTESVTIRKYAAYENVSASAYFGQFQAVISDGDELDQDWLEDRAEQEAIKNSVPNLVTEITAARIPNADLLGVVVVGDYLPVFIDHGRIQVHALHRVEKVRLNADATMAFSFGEVIEL